MTRIASTGLPLWMGLALRASTARWQPSVGLSISERASLARAKRNG